MLAEQLCQLLTEQSACLSLSSPNNFGKSTLLREITTRALASNQLLPVYLDFNLRVDDSPQAFYELVVRELIHSLKPHYPSLAQTLEKLYQSLTLPDATLFTVSRTFLAALEEVLHSLQTENQPRRLVLLLDEFDQPLRFLPGLTLLQLRALKDRFPQQLTYVVATSVPIVACGREEEEEGVAEFYELFEPKNLIRLGGLCQQQANQLALEIYPALDQAKLDHIFTLAGGHPTLIRLVAQKLASFYQAQRDGTTTNTIRSNNSEGGEDQTAELEQHLKLDSQIRLECSRIWRTLPQSEQQALFQHLEGIQVVSIDTPLGTLTDRGLVVRQADGSARIFAKTFEWFVQEKLQALEQPRQVEITSRQTITLEEPELTLPEPQIAYDPRREVVIFLNANPNQEASPSPPLPLTGNGAILFKYLFMRQSEPYCTKDELITAIWGSGGYSAENLDRLVSDLRQELGDHSKQVIRTIPRRGLQMVGVREWRGK